MGNMQSLINFFGANGFIPHGYCLTWSPTLLWLHVLSDTFIVLSYYSIPITLVYFVRQRKDLPYPWLFTIFGLFIVACGTTHLLSVITIWIPLYWLDGIVKAITAVTSVAAALAMFWVIPRALMLRSPAQLEAEVRERKQAQAASQEALDRLNKIASQVPGVVLQFRLRPDGSSCVPYASEGIREVYRVSPEEVRNDASKLFAHLHPDDLAGHMASIQTSAQDLSPWIQEYRLKFEGEPVHWFFGQALPQKEADGSVLWHGFVNDITERKRLDQALQDKNAELELAKVAAEKANLAKSEFLSSMSHELRTPLSAILGFAQLLESGSPPPTDAQIIRLHQIIKAGWYLLELINEILDLALIESGKLLLSQEPVSLAEVMLECQAMIEPQAQQRGIQINLLPFDKTWFANADRTRMKQVLINLLSNAIKYNREQGTVEVKCTASAPGRIRISIRDSGVGLPPEKLAQLFQSFNRLGQENGTEEGTGIGLVVTKRLVELMGGTIGVESTVGVGSEFWIELIRDVMPQLAAGSTKPAGLALQAQRNTKGNTALRTLLYVEDNPANLMLVEQIIADHPHVRMLSARDGKQGIALARAHLPDVILMDINLPGISGIEALNILRKDPTTAHIPVVALSANAMLHDIEKGIEAGFFRYLTKPIKVNEFMDALDDALKHAKTGSDGTINP